MHGRLMINEERCKRNMTIDDDDPVCHYAVASIIDTLRDFDEVDSYYTSRPLG
jgi:hypothetical protein